MMQIITSIWRLALAMCKQGWMLVIADGTSNGVMKGRGVVPPDSVIAAVLAANFGSRVWRIPIVRILSAFLQVPDRIAR